MASQFTLEIRRFNHKVYEARWGSVAFACEALLSLRPVLCRFWDAESFRKAGLAESKAQMARELERVDEAIQNRVFWAQLMTLEHLFDVVRAAFRWCEGCPCHSHLEHKEASAADRQRWAQCPLRGHRLPELAAGDFFGCVKSLCGVGVAKLAVNLPSDISGSDVAKCLQDFERGRAHLIFQLTLKLAWYREPPALLFALAHHDRHKAATALSVCLSSDAHHPLLQRLQSPEVRAEAVEFLEGTALADLPALARLTSELRFGFSAERLVEGGHAYVHKRSTAARCRTEAYDSLTLRIGEMKTMMLNNPEFVRHLMDAVSVARTPRALASTLGFRQHPSCQTAKGPWDIAFRKVVYRADVHSLFRTPALQTDNAPGPDAFHVGAQSAGEGGAVLPPIDTSASGQYNEFKRSAAVQFFHVRMRQLMQETGRFVFSVACGGITVRTLMGALAPSSSRASEALQLEAFGVIGDGHLSSGLAREGDEVIVDSVRVGQQLWFTVVADRPFLAKVGNIGDLRSGDLGIALHRCWHVDPESKIVTLSTTPAT